MQQLKERIVRFIQDVSLPNDFEELFSGFLSDDGMRFDIQESTHWDYKDQFPFSRSDDYFGGIMRLICAFYNTFGGIIIFGVHDTNRTPGHNKTNINIEKLNGVIREKITQPIECIHKTYYAPEYKSQSKGRVDVLLVPKRPISVMLARFTTNIGIYQKNKIFIRQNHEVLECSSNQLPFLYGSRNSFGILEDDESDAVIPSALPPSPATIKEFVGRIGVMDQLWTWLVNDDEPRNFLYGKGGSGKSTIAYEFAKMVANNAAAIPAQKKHPIDNVIFLTAKQRQLDPVSLEIQEFKGCDFSTSAELNQQILFLSEWDDYDEIASLSDSKLAEQLKELFDVSNIFLVVDDIDTLTTQGRDPGMDFLYRVLSRSKAGGKVLYTLRNAPTHSLLNAIEVPGLERDSEYPEFIRACCKQFGQPEPDESLAHGRFSEMSERRPLVVETIIALRRTCGTYDQALDLFQYRSGDDARKYLFEREYNALPSDNRGRLVLAALSLFGKPTTFSDLEVVLRFDKQQLSDAISVVNEMFLTRDNIAESETLYSLGTVTQQYVQTKSIQLDLWAPLKIHFSRSKSVITQ